MNKRNINLLLFSLFLALLVSVPILHLDRGVSIRAGWSQGPWHLIPFGADSLSQHYKDHYQVLDEKPLASLLQDSSRPLVMILVDGWGVPFPCIPAGELILSEPRGPPSPARDWSVIEGALSIRRSNSLPNLLHSCFLAQTK